MIYRLVDNKFSLLVFLAAVALVLGVLLLKTKDRRYVTGLIVVGLLAVIVAIIPLFVETDRQRIERTVRDMAASVGGKDLNEFFRHVSADFRHGDMDRKAFQQRAEKAVQDYSVRGMAVWDLQAGKISRSEGKGEIEFHFKPKLDSNEPQFRCVAKFKLDPDGQWRLVDFELFEPQSERPVRPLPF